MMQNEVQSTNTNPTDKNKKVSRANNAPYMSFHFHVYIKII